VAAICLFGMALDRLNWFIGRPGQCSNVSGNASVMDYDPDWRAKGNSGGGIFK